jgi:dihydroxy-acid dehydratase
MTEFRSQEWFTGDAKNGFIARHHFRAMGMRSSAFDGTRPIIGICNTWSELTPCNVHLKSLAEAVRRGVLEAGGVPLEFPVMSLGEPQLRPTSMFYRNLMAIEVEETLRANPLDGVVLLTGCDKTTPAALMGAASVDLPTVLLTGGPMISGSFRGRAVGSGTDIWRMSEDVRAGRASAEDFVEFESCLNRSAGHCMTMGTASTMACLTEAMGLQLPNSSHLPAIDSRRLVLAEEAGIRAVAIVKESLTLSQLLSRESFENAIVVNAAIGGSTNAVIHLLAIAGRVGVALDLDDFDTLSRSIPLLVDVQPSGRFLMQDFAEAGGLPALLRILQAHLHDTATVNGRTLKENIGGADVFNGEVIHTVSDPVQPAGSGIAVLRGSLAPNGAIIKTSAAQPSLLRHRGPALVFDSIEEYRRRMNDPELPVEPETVLVLRNAGPRGYPGMPEIGNLPLPKKLLDAGVADMVRISDGRMSGTAFGTCVLHVAPESAIGGPLGLVRDGDLIALDVDARRLDLEVNHEELEWRKAAWLPQEEPNGRGWRSLYISHVMQADRGADLDFLVGGSGSAVPRAAF